MQKSPPPPHPPKKRLRDPSKTAPSRFRDQAEIAPTSTFFEKPFYTPFGKSKTHEGERDF